MSSLAEIDGIFKDAAPVSQEDWKYVIERARHDMERLSFHIVLEECIKEIEDCPPEHFPLRLRITSAEILAYWCIKAFQYFRAREGSLADDPISISVDSGKLCIISISKGEVEGYKDGKSLKIKVETGIEDSEALFRLNKAGSSQGGSGCIETKTEVHFGDDETREKYTASFKNGMLEKIEVTKYKRGYTDNRVLDFSNTVRVLSPRSKT